MPATAAAGLDVNGEGPLIIDGAAITYGWYVGAMLFGDPGFEIDDRFAIQQAGSVVAASLRSSDIHFYRASTKT